AQLDASWAMDGFDCALLVAHLESEDVAVEENTPGGVCDSDEAHCWGNDGWFYVHARLLHDCVSPSPERQCQNQKQPQRYRIPPQDIHRPGPQITQQRSMRLLPQ